MSKAEYSPSPRSLPGQESYASPSVTDSEEVSLCAPEYMTDEFRMKHFKIDKCPKLHAHDWTTCPLAHAGEKARRRDPEEFKYAAIACIDMKNNGHCPRGDDCPYAHNVFEYWMHPTRYRTQVCRDGMKCKRQICFFAHRLEELRIPPRKPGFPPEWNKGRKHKNRSVNSKKKSSPKNESGRKGVSEPAFKVTSDVHSSPTDSDQLPFPTTSSGTLHRPIHGNVMQDAGSVEQQHNAVNRMSMPNAAGHNICHYQFNPFLIDQQQSAVESDTQTSRGLHYLATKLERALCRPGLNFGLNSQTEDASERDSQAHSHRGPGIGRMNPDLLMGKHTGIEAFNASMFSGSTINSPDASQIHSPQNIAPFPGMESDMGSPLTPPYSAETALSLDQSMYNYHPYDGQRFIVPEYQHQPYAY